MYLFTDFFRAQLFANQHLMGNARVFVNFFTNAPVLAENDTRYTGIKTISDLQGKLGWGSPLIKTVTQTLGVSTVSGNTYVMANSPFTLDPSWTASVVVTAVFVLDTSGSGPIAGTTNPIIFITDTPFQNTVIGPGDRYQALPLTALGGNRAIFSWPIPAAGATTVIPAEQPTAVIHAPPQYEISHMQHAWVFPQRVNLLANPSFELGTNHWRSNVTVSRVAPPAPGSAPTDGWAGSFSGTKAVAESNQFSLVIDPAVGSAWTIQAMVKGSGNLKVGFVGWTQEFDNTYVDWGTETWALDPNTFIHVQALRDSAESTTGMVRFETDGNLIIIDQALCEPDHLRDWPYFDGGTTYGAPDDFSWYGGENLKGQTYSLWYNHRRAVVGRLFSWSIDDDDFVVTDTEIESQGFVYKWVPAGVRVTPHMDVLWVGDIQTQPVNNAGTAILPYKTGPTDTTGITNPWPVTPSTDLLQEKFNNYTAAPWVTTGGAPAITASGRTGNAAQLNNPSDGIKYTIAAGSESDTILIGFGYKTSGLGSENDIVVLSSDAGATDHNKLRVNSAGSLLFYRGSSGLWTSAAGVIVANTWCYIEMKVKLSDTVGTLDVHVNGTSLTSQITLDTRNNGTKTTYDTIKLDTVWVVNYYDDLYVTMGATSTFKGPTSFTF